MGEPEWRVTVDLWVSPPRDGKVHAYADDGAWLGWVTSAGIAKPCGRVGGGYWATKAELRRAFKFSHAMAELLKVGQ